MIVNRASLISVRGMASEMITPNTTQIKQYDETSKPRVCGR